MKGHSFFRNVFRKNPNPDYSPRSHGDTEKMGGAP
jgi:hypothetical protein